MSNLPVIEASGSHYEIGFKVGQSAQSLMARSVATYRRTLPADGWSGPWVLPDAYLEAAREVFPHFVEELQGMADGSGIAFADLFKMASCGTVSGEVDTMTFIADHITAP